jgi:hypothetical protein
MQTSAATTPAFKVRATFPGKSAGLKEWTRDELTPIISSYKERYPREWDRYLHFESTKGFITNEMNDHIMAFLQEAVPGLHAKHYRVGVVDFRFANNEALRFAAWLPKNRDRRARNYRAHLAEIRNNHKSPRVNGDAQWTAEQVNQFIKHLQDRMPEFWARYREVLENVGFVSPKMGHDITMEVSKVFSVPEDIDYGSGMYFGVLEETNRRYGFEWDKPENQKRQRELVRQCMVAEDEHSISFDDWYRNRDAYAESLFPKREEYKRPVSLAVRLTALLIIGLFGLLVASLFYFELTAPPYP